VGVQRDRLDAAAAPETQTTAPAWLDEPSAARQVLANAIRYADARRTGQEPSAQAPVGQLVLEQTADALHVSCDALPDGREVVRIRFTGNDSAWAVALVEYLTRDCLLATARPAGPGSNATRQLRLARWHVELARHYERKARCDVESLSPSDSQEATVAPGWSTIQASHHTGRARPLDAHAARQDYDDAVQNRELAERALADAVTSQAGGQRCSGLDRRWLIMPPTVADRIGGRPSAGRVGLIGLLALLAAAVVGIWAGRLRALQQVCTVADLEMAVPLPVVGQLSLDPVSRRALHRTPSRRLVSVVTTGAELTLAVLIILFLVGVAGETATAAWLREDPLAAAAETIGRVWQRWF
jgi:hypothetical protein